MMLFVLVIQIDSLYAQTTGTDFYNRSGWHKIGDVEASFNLDNESIISMGNDKFKAIKLKAISASVNILSIDIYYGSGDVETVNLKNLITAGSETRLVELKTASPLKKVVFSYKAPQNAQETKVLIELYGLK